MNDEIIVADAYLNPTRWDQMTKLATSIIQSGAFPKAIKNAPQALVVMQAGMEMGLKPLQSLNGITIINGAVAPWGKTIGMLLRNKGWKISYQDKSENGGSCTATVTKGDETYTDTVTFQNAEKSKWTWNYRKDQAGNLVKDRNGDYIKDLKPGWYEGENRVMKLRYNALSKIIKTYIPEVMGGASDIAEVAEDYDVYEEPTTPQEDLHGKKTTEVTINQNQQKTLNDFIANEKNKKEGQKFPKVAKKVEKPIEIASNDPKTVVQQNVPGSDKAEVIDGEIVTEAEKE